MGEHFTIWIKTGCPFCIAASHLLLSQKVSHTTYVMDGDLEELDSMKEKWNHPTVPIVVHRDGDKESLVGGFTELKGWFGND